MKKLIVFSEDFLPSSTTLSPILYRIVKNMDVDMYEVIYMKKKDGKMPEWLYQDDDKKKIKGVGVNFYFSKQNILLNKILSRINLFLNKILYKVEFLKILLKNYDIVFSSTMPPGYHWYGFFYKIFHRRAKWVTFFSDPYSNSPFDLFNCKIKRDKFYLLRKIYNSYLKFKYIIQKKIRYLEEKLVFKYANKIIYVSEAQLEFSYKSENKELQATVIPFYYLNDWKKRIDRRIKANKNYDGSKINFVHPGNIYGNRTPDEFFKSLLNFTNKIHYYNCGIFDEELINKFNLKNTVTSVGYVCYEKLLENIKACDYVIIIDSFFENIQNPYMPSKVVDAMYFDKPIIAITDKGTELDKFCKITGNLSIENDAKIIEKQIQRIVDKELKWKPNYDMYCDLKFNII